MGGFLVTDDWIGRLPDPVRREISAQIQLRNIMAGATFVHAGAPPEAIYRVRSGYFKQTGLQEDGERTLLTIYAPGACFAETTVVVEAPLNHTTIALTNGVVECLPVSAFWKLYRAHGEIPDALCHKFAQAVRRVVSYREMAASSRVNAKVALVFAEMAQKVGALEPDGRYRVDLPITQFDIAAHVGVTRQSVQRELGRLQNDGAIAKRRRGWLIDLAKLPTGT